MADTSSRNMPYDPASFDAEQVQAVYPPGFRRCFLGSKIGTCDKHHVLSRGEIMGIRLADPRRKLFSSVYNLAWLGRDVHTGPARDDYRIRAYLLERAHKEILRAVREGAYEPTELDYQFIELAGQWEQKAFAHYVRR